LKTQAYSIPTGVNILGEKHFDYASVRVRTDGIVQVNSKEDFVYTIEETVEVHKAINELTDEKMMLVLHVPGRYTSIDEETRRFIASKHGLRFTIAQAFVIGSMAQRIIANFFMKVNKPARPTRFFTSQGEAEKWLKAVRHK
jgi:hypothetical protein